MELTYLKNHKQQITIYKLLKYNELLFATQLVGSDKIKPALAQGTDINFQVKYGYRARMIAVISQSVLMVEILITY